MQLNVKKALMTGGGKGIGKAIVLAYAREGADVSVAARTEADLAGFPGIGRRRRDDGADH